MNKNLKTIEQLCQISDAIVENPSLSLKDFGIVKDLKANSLIYTGVVSIGAKALAPGVAAGAIAAAGHVVIVGTGTLSGIGIVAVTGGTAGVARGASAATGIGIGIAAVIAAGGALYYRKKKKEKREKERLHREVIRRQQAVIQRMKGINIELEKKLRGQQSENEQQKQEIKRLQQEINNLREIFEVVEEQLKQFKDAA